MTLRLAVQVPLPDPEARLDFFRLVLQRPELVAAHAVAENDLAELARLTQGCSGADMQHISREAAMRPVREGLARCNPCEAGDRADAAQPDALPAIRKLVLQDFVEALKCVQPPGGVFSREE